jgi:hypothetical protein
MQQYEKRIVALSVAVTLFGGWMELHATGLLGPEQPPTCVPEAECDDEYQACANLYGGDKHDWDGNCLNLGACPVGELTLFCRAR